MGLHINVTAASLAVRAGAVHWSKQQQQQQAAELDDANVTECLFTKPTNEWG